MLLFPSSSPRGTYSPIQANGGFLRAALSHGSRHPHRHTPSRGRTNGPSRHSTRSPRKSFGLHHLPERLCMSGCMARSELKRLSWPWRTRPAMARPLRWHPPAPRAESYGYRLPPHTPNQVPRSERARVHCAQKPPRASKRLRPVPTIIDTNQTSHCTTCPGLPATSSACARICPPASQRGQSGPRHDARPRHPGRRRPPPRPRRCPRVSRGQHPARQPPVQPPPAASAALAKHRIRGRARARRQQGHG